MAYENIIRIGKGEHRRIISRFSNSVPMSFAFRADPVDAGDELSGAVEIRGSRWIFPKAVVRQDLKPENRVFKTAWDTLYRVSVIPDCDVTITMERSRITNLLPLLIIAVLITAIAAVIGFAMIR